MRPFYRAVFVIFASVAVVLFLSRIQPAWPRVGLASSTGAVDDEGCSNDAGLTLPSGFCGTVLADGIGHARDMVVAPNGVVYVNTWSSHYYGNKPPHDGGFLVALQDTTSLGKANVVERFGETPQSGGAGGNGIALYKNAIYAEINDRIVTFHDKGGSTAALEHPQTNPRYRRGSGGLALDAGRRQSRRPVPIHLGKAERRVSCL
jgi:hypothetical protein